MTYTANWWWEFGTCICAERSSSAFSTIFLTNVTKCTNSTNSSIASSAWVARFTLSTLGSARYESIWSPFAHSWFVWSLFTVASNSTVLTCGPQSLTNCAAESASSTGKFESSRAIITSGTHWTFFLPSITGCAITTSLLDRWTMRAEVTGITCGTFWRTHSTISSWFTLCWLWWSFSAGRSSSALQTLLLSITAESSCKTSDFQSTVAERASRTWCTNWLPSVTVCANCTFLYFAINAEAPCITLDTRCCAYSNIESRFTLSWNWGSLSAG